MIQMYLSGVKIEYWW